MHQRNSASARVRRYQVFWIRPLTLAALLLLLTYSSASAEGRRGDANCDGKVNALDAALILQSAAALTQLNCPDKADVNHPIGIDSIDAQLVLQYVAGLSLFPGTPPAKEPIGQDIISTYPAGDYSMFSPYGVVYRSLWDGTNQVQVTPDGVEASFVGVGSGVVYYLERVAGDTFNLKEHRDLGETRTLASFSVPYAGDKPPSGQLDSSGRYIAFHSPEGIELYDLIERSQQRILTNERAGCSGPDVFSSCWGFYDPHWSPDGTSLLVKQIFFEGSRNIVVNPFATNPPFIPLEHGTWAAKWSTDSRSACHYGTYPGGGDLYISRAPEWTISDIVHVERPGVFSCAWLDNARVIYGTDSARGTEVVVVNPHDATRHTVLRTTASVRPSDMFVLSESVLGVNYVDATYPPSPQRPRWLNIITGESIPILSAGDQIVALVPSGD